MIIDKATIYLRSGKGGEGSSAITKLSSRKVVASGGDGGRGGNVILRVSPHLYDLSKFRGSKKFIASDGEKGKARNKKGKDAQDLIVNLPSGTRVLDHDQLVSDLVGQGEEFLICQGGRGGKGNHKRGYTISAQISQEREVTLDYRIPNDIAILGFANSGKTSLFNALTNQHRKVAAYPFTTTSCFWANGEYEFQRFRVLDTPPFKKSKDPSNLTENTFLRHTFRSKILLLLSDKRLFEEDFRDLKKEISLYDSRLLGAKKIFYLLTKIDTIDKKATRKEYRAISVNKPETIETLKLKISKSLEEL